MQINLLLKFFLSFVKMAVKQGITTGVSTRIVMQLLWLSVGDNFLLQEMANQCLSTSLWPIANRQQLDLSDWMDVIRQSNRQIALVVCVNGSLVVLRFNAELHWTIPTFKVVSSPTGLWVFNTAMLAFYIFFCIIVSRMERLGPPRSEKQAMKWTFKFKPTSGVLGDST